MTDLRVRRTYQLLCQALDSLLEKKSFSDITVSELCDTAMVRRTTFYDHFANKQEFFRFYVRQMRDAISASVHVEDPNMDFTEYCRFMTRKFIAVIKSKKVALKHMRFDGGIEVLSFVVAEEIASEVKPIVLREFKMRGSDESLAQEQAHTFAIFYAQGLTGLIVEWIREDFSRSEKELIMSFETTILPMIEGIFPSQTIC